VVRALMEHEHKAASLDFVGLSAMAVAGAQRYV
jgi:hypothetical protein